MSNGNSVTLIGNATRDPELRFTASGQATATFGLAVSRRWQNRQTNEWDEVTSFFNIVCWRELAENVAESVHKGTRIIVTGRLEQRSFEGQDGQKRNVVEVVADEVGPSLRWASAQVSRNERRSGDAGGYERGAGGGGGGYDRGGGGGGQERGGGRAASAASEPPQDYGYDEEPF